LLHISEISHDHIDTPHSVFNVNDEVKVMIIDLDAERGRISLSTKQLEPEAGDMVKNPDKVYEKAEEMAAKYREQMRAKQQAQQQQKQAAQPAAQPVAAEPTVEVPEEEIVSAEDA
jgi:small subunit ribosomal protein S1